MKKKRKDTFRGTAFILLFLSSFLFVACASNPSPKNQEELDRAQKLNQEGKKLFKSGKPREALALLDQSLAICQGENHKICIADNLNIIGLIYITLEEKEKATRILKQALPVNQEIKNWHALAAVLNSLGKIENDMGNDAEALRYFNESLKVSLQLNYPVGLGTTFNNIGKIYYHRREYAQALHYYNQALESFVAGGDRERARVVMGNIRLAENKSSETAMETATTPISSGEEGNSASPGLPEKSPADAAIIPASDIQKREDLANPEPDEKEKAPQKIIPREITIWKNLLNLHDSPSISSPVKGKVLRGGVYPVLDHYQGVDPKDVFFKIQLNNGKIGWINDSENR